jgi:hypothetical protein
MCGKRKFATKSQALRAALFDGMRAYYCRGCRAWVLTSQTRRAKRKRV